MDIESLLSFVRYQKGQKAGWDALDEVLTAVTDSEARVKDADSKVKALEAVLATKHEELKQAQKDLDAQFEAHAAKEDDYKASVEKACAEAQASAEAKIAAIEDRLKDLSSLEVTLKSAVAKRQSDLDALNTAHGDASAALELVQGQLAKIKANL